MARRRMPVLAAMPAAGFSAEPGSGVPLSGRSSSVTKMAPSVSLPGHARRLLQSWPASVTRSSLLAPLRSPIGIESAFACHLRFRSSLLLLLALSLSLPEDGCKPYLLLTTFFAGDTFLAGSQLSCAVRCQSHASRQGLCSRAAAAL